ncbi:MAG: hypothetical protein ACKO9V_02465, partial [Candidatus Kapaibacterium sp.]
MRTPLLLRVLLSAILLAAVIDVAGAAPIARQRAYRDNDARQPTIQSESPWRKGLEADELGEDPMLREEEFWKQRAFPFDRVPTGALERAIARQEQMARRKG